MIRDPNKKGVLGEIAVIKALCASGYEVFQSVGNHSRVDLIVLSGGVPIKIQVKSTYSKDGIVTIYSRKTCLNPEYNYTYSVNDFDIFAVYIIDKDLVCYISSYEVLANKTMFKLRFEDAKNNQAKGVRYISDYIDLKNAVNNCKTDARMFSDDKNYSRSMPSHSSGTPYC